MSSDLAFGLHAVERGAEAANPRGRAAACALQHGPRRCKRVRGAVAEAGGETAGVDRRSACRAVHNSTSSSSGRHQGVGGRARVRRRANGGGPALERGASCTQRAQAERSQPLVLVLDGVTDPHNLGACLRSADAAGVLTAVIPPKDNAADITPVVRKVACGATETVPLVRVTNLARCLDGLKEAGLWLYGAAGEANSPLYDCDLSGPLALVMGAEGRGLRRLTRERCDVLSQPAHGRRGQQPQRVRGERRVCLFEAVRQRRPGADA
jgi:23S rRNA (guanosine2251-2'-O)-methyltransferase